jgi:hypothetical protein
MRPVRAWHVFDRLKLFQRRAAGLVDHHVFAGFHRLDGKRCAIARDGGNENEVDLGVGEDRILVRHSSHVRKTLQKAFFCLWRPASPPAFEGSANILHVAGHAKNVAVVDAKGCEG